MLRPLAIAAPQFEAARVGQLALSSRDPASLFNACRHSAALAEAGVGAWGESPWAHSRADRRAAVLLLEEFEGSAAALQEQMERLRPNLLLIGAMSICLPGAIACARLAKECLGPDVCVVLGGRHPSESFARIGGELWHHASSPLRLMAQGVIARHFDVVVSGDGEYIVAALGELVGRLLRRGQKPAEASRHLDELAAAPGRWVAGAVVDGQVVAVDGRSGPIDYANLPARARCSASQRPSTCSAAGRRRTSLAT